MAVHGLRPCSPIRGSVGLQQPFFATAPAATIGAVSPMDERPATTRITQTVFVPVGVIGMPRPEGLQNVAVILAALVGVVINRANGRAGGAPWYMPLMI